MRRRRRQKRRRKRRRSVNLVKWAGAYLWTRVCGIQAELLISQSCGILGKLLDLRREAEEKEEEKRRRGVNWVKCVGDYLWPGM